VSPDRPLLIGVDVGTTRIKAGVIDLDGTELGRTARPTIWHMCPTGAQADPGDFTRAVEEALAELLASAPPGVVAGIGITGMAETAVLIGPGGGSVGPAIAWYDRRAQDDFADMEARLTRAEIGANTGLTPSLIPTIAMLRWLMRTEPELRTAQKVVSVAEWIAYELSGTIASELSLASRTGALQITSGRWWPEVIDWAQLPPSLFAELRPAGSDWGTAKRSTPGLERLAGATVTVAGHDHLVASIGSGVSDSTQIMDSCGTAEAVMRALPAAAGCDPAAGLDSDIATGWHALPDHFCMIAGLPLGIELSPLLEQLGATHSGGHTSLDDAVLETLEALAPSPAPGTPAQRWLAAVQAAVTRSSAAVGALERLGGPVDEVRVSGGWARNPVIRRVKDMDPHPHVYPLVAEAGVRGAGMMAGAAAGLFESIAHLPAPRTDVDPAECQHGLANQSRQPRHELSR
jgi:sugar (pentulose or hexulose) kinase